VSTDTSEKGLEDLIVESLVGYAPPPESVTEGVLHESRIPFGHGYKLGSPADYDRTYAVDLTRLRDFLWATQPEIVEKVQLDQDTPARRSFLDRLQGEITKHGVVHVLRNGIKHGPMNVDLYYGTPSDNNPKAKLLFEENVFSVTRQLQYSKDEMKLALDLCIFINGLPVATFELKNELTNQTVDHAVKQYKLDRDPKELLFQPGRCIVHFAVDDAEVRMCAELKGKDSWFLPFNRGWNDGAGNPPNPNGLKTDYLWKRILAKHSLADIVENYAQVLEFKNEKGHKTRQPIFPRYHQLDVVRLLLRDVRFHRAGKRYLIQHSAGSGKSNSIAWLAHQLAGLELDGKTIFDSVIVVTDRKVLDKQINDTVKQFAQVSSVVGHADHSAQLKAHLLAGKRIIITTVQKFPVILDAIAKEHLTRKFALIIDEAHSSQGGRTSSKMNVALAEHEGADDDWSIEDEINALMAAKKMLPNASYFAFTATPKNKTLETFGEPYQEDGVTKHRPFHSYTMKQAIQEQFILDVLASYTPVDSYVRLTTKIDGDPEFDVKKARKKLWHYVQSHSHAIHERAEIIVDHFHEQVLDRNKIGGEARAMVITDGIKRAIEYFHAIQAYLVERKSPYRAIVAFSGEHEYGGHKVSESYLNGFASNLIPGRFVQHPYRFLVVADKFQTGYDEPLLHTMYVDKHLSGIKAVQTLSRLNRSHPKKHDTFVLDFMNDSETIEEAFAPYYRTTVLSGETDPNKLHDLKDELDAADVFTQQDVDSLVELYLSNAPREKLDPILDACVDKYKHQLAEEDEQVAFKGKAKAFVRTYGFLSTILPYTNAEWEKLATFLNFLIPKLPAPKEEDQTQSILETIDMDSYRVEVRKAMELSLPDDEGEVGPVPVGLAAAKPEPEMDILSNIVRAFNDEFGNIEWKDRDKIAKVIAEELPAKVSADVHYQNAIAHSDKQNARIEHDKVLQRIITDLLNDHTELYKQYSDNPSFKKWLADTIFAATYA